MQRNVCVHGLAILATMCLLYACTATTRQGELVPVVKGDAAIWTVWKNKLSLSGDEVFLVPMTKASQEFMDAHKDDYYIERTLLLGLPGVMTAVVDQNNGFVFRNVPQGTYYVYWQYAHDKVRNPLDNSDSNMLLVREVSASHPVIHLSDSN